ncbi:MAG: hypothetical protein ACREX8_19805, partial [Gammaproteobacteria bacterium]
MGVGDVEGPDPLWLAAAVDLHPRSAGHRGRDLMSERPTLTNALAQDHVDLMDPVIPTSNAARTRKQGRSR